jgi:hypothetical protein
MFKAGISLLTSATPQSMEPRHMTKRILVTIIGVAVAAATAIVSFQAANWLPLAKDFAAFNSIGQALLYHIICVAAVGIWGIFALLFGLLFSRTEITG